jgi:hypothetical protein
LSVASISAQKSQQGDISPTGRLGEALQPNSLPCGIILHCTPCFIRQQSLSRVGFLETRSSVRRGEGGGERRGGPLWSPAVPFSLKQSLEGTTPMEKDVAFPNDFLTNGVELRCFLVVSNYARSLAFYSPLACLLPLWYTKTKLN